MNTREYLQIWSEASAEVASQALGAAFKVELEQGSDPGPVKPEADAGVWLEFAVADPISAKQAFWISPAAALYLGQSFMGEDPDPLAPLTPDHCDAAAELFRQIAGNAALALKSRVGKECPINFSGSVKPGWSPDVRGRFQWMVEGHPPFAVEVQLDSELRSSEAQSAAKPQAPAPPPPTPFATPPPAPAAPAPASERNLDLLLEIRARGSDSFWQA